MMKNKAIMIFAVSAMLLTGCTKSNILSSGGPAEPVFETQKGIQLDWTQINTDIDEEFTENEQYPMALSVNYDLDKDKKTMNMTLMVKHGTTPDQAVEFANAAVKFLNDEVATQDFSYERSSDTSYGGFMKEYDLKLIVMPDYTMKENKYWLVDMDIPKGSDQTIVPKEGAEIMETTAADEEDTEEESSEEVTETKAQKETEASAPSK
jgi:hypothetical protein